ncbi:polymorphic toxin type 44 domain-containing protein [Salinibius halmophilus]|uniref:polymorphic toxin type 44 domain-containing protein n=1 Tax=Salinibius halmophilus TaxID=1853216 RepID=UPI000E667B55|nr:polymorphic toxin type 44 domain-containing protein [Salinibius halmophilus]
MKSNNRSFTYDDFDRLTEVVNLNSGRRANYVYMGGKLAVSIDAPSGQGGEQVYTFFLPHGFKYSVVETFANRQRTTKVTHSLSASGINMLYDPSEGTTTQAVLRNHLGNMVAVLASNETNRIDPYKISPYGLTQNGGNAKTNQLVQDKPQYDNFQIVHFSGRVYDLYSRQFLTPDPIVPNHSNISHWGRYSYGYGNPYGHVDPTGYRQLETGGYIEGGSIPSQSSGDVPEGDKTAPVSHTSDGTIELDYFANVPDRYKPILKDLNISLHENVELARKMGLKRLGVSKEWAIAGLLEFVEYVETGSEWDYKTIIDDSFSEKDRDDFGNWHFGIVAGAYGFNLEQSMYGGGVYQVLKQGGGSPIELGIATEIMSSTLAGITLPDRVTINITSNGFGWGDNSGDAFNVMEGWLFYESNF